MDNCVQVMLSQCIILSQILLQYFLWIHKWCENMKLTFELLSACCTPVPARTKHVQSSERIISQFKACEFIIQILYILFLHKSRVTTTDIAWHQGWCDMSIVKPEYIIWIKIRAKTFFTNFGLWAHNFFVKLSSSLSCSILVW